MENGSETMRGIGILIMVGVAIGTGFYAAQKIRERLEVLTVLCQMVHHLMGRILQVNEALPQALQEVGQRFLETQEGKRMVPAKMFLQVAGRLNRERWLRFSEIWNEEIQKLTGEIAIRKEDIRNLEELGAFLGYSDRKMQEKTLQFYLEQTQDVIEELKAEIHTKTKLYRSLGMAAGIFLFVFLI